MAGVLLEDLPQEELGVRAELELVKGHADLEQGVGHQLALLVLLDDLLDECRVFAGGERVVGQTHLAPERLQRVGVRHIEALAEIRAQQAFVDPLEGVSTELCGGFGDLVGRDGGREDRREGPGCRRRPVTSAGIRQGYRGAA